MTPERIAELIPEALTGYYGHKCKDFNDNCICCQAWAELSRLTRERDEAYEAGMREAGSIATLEPDLHVKSEYQAGYEQGRNAASVAIYERATAIRALRKPKTGGE